MSSKSIGWLVGIFVLFPIFVFIYNRVMVSENDGAKYLQVYLQQIIPYKIVVPQMSTAYTNQLKVEYDSYRAGANPIGFKGITGQLMLISIYDKKSRKFFKIYLCDINRQRTFSLADKLEGKEILVYVNKEDLTDSDYGTQKNPVPVFNFTGTNEKIAVESTDNNNNLVMRSLEPTKPECEHNVLTYLTYLMSEDAFKARFLTNTKH
ncbi:hypothetical protein [Mucilaginibacter sp. PAMB04168]|uniref:hypothetical protein n=1 Tax=Mucilaginibacter sp. PAMB04168 TaxID=3138567 RepID=UPI0031F6C1F1